MSNLTTIPQNYKNNVDWILGAYTDAGVSFPNGFQKDAIQNAVGARATHKFKNWSCDISYVSTPKGNFIVIEDIGTVGLTGSNTHADIIKDMMSRGETLDREERLSRFTSMFNSGGNTTGGGLFGAGKSVYSVASNTYTYYFDSLRKDKKYVANINKCGQVMPTALEEDEARAYIQNETGLAPKDSVGTRIIIQDPKKELVDSINSGEIIPFIQESWWLIIQRLGADSKISVNGVAVTIPEGVKEGNHNYELEQPETYLTNYKVKHFGFYVFEKGGNIWNTISYYRKGMKIGEVEIKEIPSKLDGKFWGYIEVDEAWEEELADIEDKVHFGVSRGKKQTRTYQNLKNYCAIKIKEKLIEWGYIKDKENEDKRLKEELKQIAEDIQDLFDKLGFEDLGKGPQKSDFDVRWQDISYPIEGTEEVTTSDEIKFSFRIKSTYSNEKKLEYRLYVANPKTGAVISTIENEKITISTNNVFKKDFIHKITPNTSEQFAENRITLLVKVIGSGKEKRKELPYFYDIKKPDNSRECVDLSLHECVLPREGSRRINFNESITSVSYRIANKRNCPLNYKLNISIHNASDPTCPQITSVATLTGTIKPFEEDITTPLPPITFEQNIYEQYLSEGILELRARLIANDDDDEFEKGDKITFYNFKVFFNRDEKNGKNDAFEVKSTDDPEDFRRAWCEVGTSRTIFLNVGHVAYLALQDYSELQYNYLREQMLKQYVLLYLKEGKYDMFSEKSSDFIELEPQEAADRVLDKIERVYTKSLM